MSPMFRITFLYLTLVFMQAAHSAEEYFTDFFDWFPVIKITGQTFIILNIVIVVFLLLFVPFIFRKMRWAMIIARIAVVIEILNGLVHIIAAFYVGGYFPGLITAVGLVIIGLLLLKSINRWSGLVADSFKTIQK